MRIPGYTIIVLVLILILLSGWKRGYFSCSRQEELKPRQQNQVTGISVSTQIQDGFLVDVIDHFKPLLVMKG